MASENATGDVPAESVGAEGTLAKRRLDKNEDAAPAAGPATDASTGAGADAAAGDGSERQPKRAKTSDEGQPTTKREKIPGIALIKEEYLITDPAGRGRAADDDVNDDAAEGRGEADNGGGRGGRGGFKGGKKKQRGGQNKERDFGHSRDLLRLCGSVAHSREFAPKVCRAGEGQCRALHDLRQYLREGRRADVTDTAFGRECPVFAVYGRCPSGWKCRFVGSHMKEVEHADGRKELVLVEKEVAKPEPEPETAEAETEQAGPDADADVAYTEEDDARPGVVNVVSAEAKHNLTRRRMTLDRSEQYLQWLNQELSLVRKIYNQPAQQAKAKEAETPADAGEAPPDKTPDEAAAAAAATAQDYRAQFVDPPFLPSEKRRLYFGPETPTLAPLTTQGNLPFRRLCVELGCELTYSEMALGVDLVTGKQAEWARMKAHVSERAPPRIAPGPGAYVPAGYAHGRDVRFGAQIAANQPWQAIKATEALARLVPHLRVIDMNCGCPIDMVYKSGGGAGLLEAHNKLERMVRGMNAVSGAVPITAKLRIGVRDDSPLAPKVLECLAFGGVETRARLGAPGCAAVTLHGRTRNQRYKKPADWGYIAECAALVRAYNAQRDALADTARAPDPRTQANSGGRGTADTTGGGHMFFLGNGDCYSHVQYAEQIAQAGVDSVMIGRGAIIKPWLFEEIQAGQYLDKTATERLAYVEKYARYGLEAWGTDEMGLGTTRRFLLEYLSFASRYVPIGLLEHLPPSLSDRPQAFRGRNELETLLASRNYKDWIKISEMFLGPAHPDFKFIPKHKSNSYEMEAEG